MKKLLFTLAFALMAFTANAQSCPDNNHPHMIDLGLPSGTKWACCNVGADKPEEKGGYYAWGETEEKDYYDWSTYIHCDGSYDTCHNLGSDIAGTQYDVAHVLWGGSWVMPTEEQFKELFEYCDNCEDFMPTELGSVKGIKITSRKNGKSIFLRGAGFRRDNEFQGGTMSQYWTSTPNSDNTTITCWVRKGEHLVKSFAGFLRFIGASVRPVCKLNMKDNKAGSSSSNTSSSSSIKSQNKSDIAYFNKVKIQTTIDAVGNGVKGKLVFVTWKGCKTNEVPFVYFVKNTHKDSNSSHIPARITALVYHDTGDGKEFLGIEVIEDIYENETNPNKLGYMEREIKLDDVSAQYLIDFITGDKEWKNNTNIKYRETTSPNVKNPYTFKF